MKTLLTAACVSFSMILTATAEPTSFRDELMYPVNPPRMVFPNRTLNVDKPAFQSIPARSPEESAKSEYKYAIRFWSVSHELIEEEKFYLAQRLLNDVKTRVQEIQKKHPKFQPRNVEAFSIIVSDEILALDAKKKEAMASAMAKYETP